MAAVRKILVVGGGTAGWIAACYLARTLNAVDPKSIEIALVESADIGILGVGEGTFPSIRGTPAAIGLPEATFLRGAHATFKQGIRFAHWVRPRGEPGAVIQNTEQAVAQAMSIVRHGRVNVQEGTQIPLRGDTICIHGDGENAMELARALRTAFERDGVSVRPPGEAE